MSATLAELLQGASGISGNAQHTRLAALVRENIIPYLEGQSIQTPLGEGLRGEVERACVSAAKFKKDHVLNGQRVRLFEVPPSLLPDQIPARNATRVRGLIVV